MSARFLIAAGGTGGHVYPALTIARELQSAAPTSSIHFVGGRRGIEGRLVPDAGFSLSRLPASGLRGTGAVGALRFACNFGLAFLASLLLVMKMRPDVVLATGGYASAAPAAAAAMLGRPLWIQEQNSVPGSTNRFLSRFAEEAFLAFAEATDAMSRARHISEMPNPVRREILQARDRKASPRDFASLGLDPGRPTVLIFGGSRGSARMNQAVRDGWAQVAAKTSWQGLIQTGEQEFEEMRGQLLSDRAAVRAYLEDMATAYSVADLVISRAGALTLAELAAVSKPAILVPYPHATDDHQFHNASAIEEAGAARVVADAEMNGDVLFDLLLEFERNPAALETMGEAAAEIAAGRNGAAELAAALISRAQEGSKA